MYIRLHTHFELHPCIIQVINVLCIGIHLGVNRVNIQAFTTELCKGKEYAVGEECFHDVTISNPVDS